jgi:hypothetical protein
MSRFIMSALLCTFAFAQSANAIAPVSVAKRNSRELAALQAKDPNDATTLAGKQFELEKKQDCPLARHNGDRNDNTQPAKEQVAAVSGGAVNSHDTVR